MPSIVRMLKNEYVRFANALVDWEDDAPFPQSISDDVFTQLIENIPEYKMRAIALSDRIAGAEELKTTKLRNDRRDEIIKSLVDMDRYYKSLSLDDDFRPSKGQRDKIRAALTLVIRTIQVYTDEGSQQAKTYFMQAHLPRAHKWVGSDWFSGLQILPEPELSDEDEGKTFASMGFKPLADAFELLRR